jgi:hypothetical protein
MTSAAARRRWARLLAIVTAGTFLISSIFPVIAGLSNNTASFPKWWGVVDVLLAFFLAILVMVILAFAGHNVDQQATAASYRTYRILIHGILVMIIIFFLFGDRIVWINCLTGLAWRAWLLLYCLPAWSATVRAAGGRIP